MQAKHGRTQSNRREKNSHLITYQYGCNFYHCMLSNSVSRVLARLTRNLTRYFALLRPVLITIASLVLRRARIFPTDDRVKFPPRQLPAITREYVYRVSVYPRLSAGLFRSFLHLSFASNTVRSSLLFTLSRSFVC